MSDPTCPRALIATWPSLSAFARDIGVNYGTAKKMRARNSISVDHWPAVISSVEGRKKGYTSDLLMRIHVSTSAVSEVAA